MEELTEYRHDILSKLQGTIDELSGLASGIAPDAWRTRVGPYTRTPHFILAHLLMLERQVFATQLHRIVQEDHSLVPLFDDQAWMQENYDADMPAALMLEEFAALRLQEVTWLCSLPPESWSCCARHPWWGVRALQWWVELQLDYSRQHVAELATSVV